MKKGLLVILSGPSGVGKGTVREILMKDKSLNLEYSISMTTRLPRNGEQNGREYFFTTREEFENRIKNDGLLEYAEFVHNYYGTPRDYVFKKLEEGKNVLLEIETKGAQQVMEKLQGNGLISIFLLPPSLNDLQKRIEGRKTETQDVIKQRLKKAYKEMQLKALYDYNVVNDTPERAAKRIAEIIKGSFEA